MRGDLLVAKARYLVEAQGFCGGVSDSRYQQYARI